MKRVIGLVIGTLLLVFAVAWALSWLFDGMGILPLIVIAVLAAVVALLWRRHRSR